MHSFCKYSMVENDGNVKKKILQFMKMIYIYYISSIIMLLTLLIVIWLCEKSIAITLHFASISSYFKILLRTNKICRKI